AGAAPLHAEDADARFLPGAGGRDHAGARYRGGPSQGWRYGGAARYQSRLEQSIERALPRRVFLTRCDSLIGRERPQRDYAGINCAESIAIPMPAMAAP